MTQPFYLTTGKAGLGTCAHGPEGNSGRVRVGSAREGILALELTLLLIAKAIVAVPCCGLARAQHGTATMAPVMVTSVVVNLNVSSIQVTGRASPGLEYVSTRPASTSPSRTCTAASSSRTVGSIACVRCT